MLWRALSCSLCLTAGGVAPREPSLVLFGSGWQTRVRNTVRLARLCAAVGHVAKDVGERRRPARGGQGCPGWEMGAVLGEVRDPVYGCVVYDEFEGNLMNARPFQKLRRVKQLGVIQMA